MLKQRGPNVAQDLSVGKVLQGQGGQFVDFGAIGCQQAGKLVWENPS